MTAPQTGTTRDVATGLAFDRLVAEVNECHVCPRMDGRRRLLSRANGALRPRVVFIAEAPGRLGGDRTAVPLAGDQSGRNFDRLLAAAGLHRDDIFITNAVLCNPRDAAGRNAPPTPAELGNCSRHLAATIHLVQPPVIVTLGAVALRALQRLHPHDLLLARDVGRAVRWHECWLMPLYHPGPRAQIHRDFTRQADDFRQLAAFLQDLDQGAIPH